MKQAEPNSYSGRWFECFHLSIAESRTIQEIDFVCACAPLPDFGRVLDVCCGTGRHARVLASRGYLVTGLERDPAAVMRARELAAGPTYIQTDVRNFQADPDVYDVAIVMSQSFGFFDAATNRELLRRLTRGVRYGGRIILDLWNPQFFATHQGERELGLPGEIVRETKWVRDGRLFVQLNYPGGGGDDFEWQLYTPSEMRSMAGSIGLRLATVCTDFDAAIPSSPENPRIQLVLQK